MEERDLLVEALDHKDSRVRAGICEVLGIIKYERSLPLILGLLRDDSNEEVKRSASMAISNIALSSSVEPLIEMLHHWDSRTVLYSIQVLGDLSGTESYEPLAERLHDYDPLIRAASAEAIGKLNIVEAIDVLEKALSVEESSYVREKLTQDCCKYCENKLNIKVFHRKEGC